MGGGNLLSMEDMARRGMKKTDLLEVVSAPTLAKLSKGKTVTTEVISNICNFLNCQPGDLMEYVSDRRSKGGSD